MFALGVLQSHGFRDRIKMHLVLVDHQERSTTRFARAKARGQVRYRSRIQK
jgi:hypothetical protein